MMHASAASRHGPGFHGRRFSRVQGDRAIHVLCLNVSERDHDEPVSRRQPHRLRDWDGDQHSSSGSHRARGQTAGRQRSQYPVRDLQPNMESGRSRAFRRPHMRRARTGTSGAHHPGLSVHCSRGMAHHRVKPVEPAGYPALAKNRPHTTEPFCSRWESPCSGNGSHRGR